MPYPLNNYTTPDAYNDATGLVILSPPRPSFQMLVTNNSIYYQYAPSTGDRHPNGETFVLEVLVPPGRYFFDESDSRSNGGNGNHAMIRIRSGVTGLPAQVTVS